MRNLATFFYKYFYQQQKNDKKYHTVYFIFMERLLTCQRNTNLEHSQILKYHLIMLNARLISRLNVLV